MAVQDPAKAEAGVRWTLAGTMIQACNCAWGCPCEFNSLPTDGYCHGTWSWHAKEGAFGSTSLAGIHFAAACKWPGPIHEGNGEVLPILDSAATESQLQAIGILLGGKAGGPWGIIATTLTKVHEPRVVDWLFEENGNRSRLRGGDVFELELEPMHNPVTKEPFEATVLLPDGFTSKALSHANSVKFRVGDPIDYAYPGHDAAVGSFEYEGVLAE